jgi:phosphoenolpyruvate synthase/pyruvate phosphate dikinase
LFKEWSIPINGVVYSNYSKEEDFFVESSFGLGEGITSGQVIPDKYFVSRGMEIKSKDVSKKNLAFTRDSSGSLRIVKLKRKKFLFGSFK